MDAQHIHLLFNHAPIFLTLFGILVFSFGLLKKQTILEKTGLLSFVASGLLSFPTYFSGENAEEKVEDLAGVSHAMIHEHEEMAETAFFMLIGLMVASLILLFVMWKAKEMKNSGMMKILVLVLAVLSFSYLAIVGNNGGKIRRPELRIEKTDDKNMQVDEDHYDDHDDEHHEHMDEDH